MQIVRFSHQSTTGWGLLDRQAGEIRQVLGDLNAWAPLIANGAGLDALPCSGKRYPLAEVQLIAPIEANASIYSDRGSLDPDGFAVSPGVLETPPAQCDRVAVVVIGAPLTGRGNPLRSVLGYGVACRTSDDDSAEAETMVFAPGIEIRHRFGDMVPDLADSWEESFGAVRPHFPGLGDLTAQLARLNAFIPLKVGDAVLVPF